MKISDFNKVFNQYDEKVYFSHTEYVATGKKRYISFSDLISIIKSESVSTLEIAYELTNQVTLIETEDKRFVDYLNTHKSVNTYVIKNKNKFQFLFKKHSDDKNIDEYTTNVLTRATKKVQTDRKKTFIVLPFKTTVNTSDVLKHINEVYENKVEYLDEAPFELKPLVDKSFTNYSYRYPIKDESPINHLLKVLEILKQHLRSYDDIHASLTSINVVYCDHPCKEEELEELLSDDSLIAKKFISINGTYKYDHLAKYLITKFYIKYNAYDNLLYHYDETTKVYLTDEKYMKSIIFNMLPTMKSDQINEALETIRRVAYLNKVEFNSNPFTVLFSNGVYNLVEQEFTQMSPNVLETNLIGAKFDPSLVDKGNLIVDEFFYTFTLGNEEVEKLIYQAIGYSMFRTNQYQVSFMIYGGGKNGKSTLFDLIKATLRKENGTNVSFKDLTNTFRPAKLENKLYSIAPDISSSEMEESDSMKSVISGDDITIERKNKDSYDRPVYTTMWFGCNKLPRTPDNSYGFYRRFVVIPAKADLRNIKMGEGFKFREALLKQENLDYVANKALMAFSEVYHKTNEFTIPKVVEAETTYYKDISDNVRQFINNKGDLLPEYIDDWEPNEINYKNYVAFCLGFGYKPKGFNTYEASFLLYKEELLNKETED